MIEGPASVNMENFERSFHYPQRIENRAREENIRDFTSVRSLAALIYKGMFLAEQLSAFILIF